MALLADRVGMSRLAFASRFKNLLTDLPAPVVRARAADGKTVHGEVTILSPIDSRPCFAVDLPGIEGAP